MDYGAILRKRGGLSKKKVNTIIGELEVEYDAAVEYGYNYTAYLLEEQIKNLNKLL